MNAWKFPFLNTKIGSRRIGRSEVQCPVCERIFNNNLPWNAQYCPMCGAYNGYRNEVKNNAPTVETLKDITEVHCDITIEQLLNALRPQGEWISNYTSQFFNPGRYCSLCGKVVEFSENYCPGCGAKMRGTDNG